jgi:glycerol-3-phosphate O-acyltransferase
MQKIITMPKGKLGKVFVKYCEPIDLNDYVADYSRKNSKIDFEQLSMQLTNDLYEIYMKQ